MEDAVMTTTDQPPAEALTGRREVARISTAEIDDEALAKFIDWAEQTYGDDLAAKGDGDWLTFWR